MHRKHSSTFSARRRIIVAAISACFASAPAWSNPTGPQVVSGSASFTQAGNLLTVNNTNGAIINWNTFSIGANETTRFNQATTSSSVLNRVLANDPSVLLGTLSSNGHVWLINPAGIMVGQGARIDVAGFVASTLNVANEDFLAGRLNFGATPNAGSIQNYGQITTPSGGSVYLVAPAVTNNGIINAPNGEVILAAGQTVQLIDTGTPGVSVTITGAKGNVTNLGQIISDAGRIGMAGVLVKNSGTLDASSVVKEGGRIFLKASQDVTLDAASQIKANAGQAGNGGNISVLADGTAYIDGAISAQGGSQSGNGGFIETSGAHVKIADSTQVSTLASNGKSGTWLIDPADFTIATSGGDMTGATLGTALNGSPVTILSSQGTVNTSGNGDIFVNDAVSWNSANSLTLNAIRNISVNQYISDSGTGGVNLYAGGGISNASSISTYGSISLLAGGAITFGNTSTSGSVYSYGSPITLVANWNGSTSTPDVAAAVQCGTVFCGINGSGSINSYSYSSSVANAGGVTLKAPGDIDLTNISIYAYGGYGSNSGGVGGTGGTVNITSTQGKLTVSSINATGGGGNSGTSGTSSVVNGGAGGAGGVGGTVNLSAAGTLTQTGTTDVSGGYGGSGGSGNYTYNYSTSTYVYSGTGGNAGAGGNAGSINMSGPSVVASGASLNAHGGTGGTGGQGTTLGSSGVGGTGGNVTLTATTGDLTTGYSINAIGGTGGTGATGTSSVVNGATGGTGGVGGTVSLNAAGTLTLGGTTDVSGGSGGTGGSGYYDNSLTPTAYTGTRGTGGAGGNAGAMSMSEAALVLSGATLNAQGGAGGSGGYYGTASGSTGAIGAASPITLSTVGGIVVTGSDYANASQLNLFAGKSITFGTTGTSPTSGYLNSDYVTPMTLLANWDGASTSVPAIAASGQCTGTSFCGISGSGSINSNYSYWGTGVNAGAVTLKAPGDIDLTNISIYAYGGYGSNSGGVGGTGGTVNITSTQGKLTVSSINATGGGGNSGTSGTSSAVNGGAGGTGGTGGTVNLSAAGTLTQTGTTDVSGGSGGYGGSGYSTYNYSTSTTVYSGTGGNAGMGGNAGTINMSGPSLVASGASLNAHGGTGGTGGQGTTLGSSGVGGTGGNVTLTATTGDLTSGYNINAIGGTGGAGATGTSSVVNGATGGTGGVGGTVSLSAAGMLTLTGTTNVTGGSGGSGGNGYYDYSLTPAAYTGTGGTGGAGGNAGTMSMNEASLVLSGATLNAQGGAGGSGGYYGTASGSVGAIGAASPITLSTAGAISVTGSDHTNASQLNLFAGKSISFGTAATSTTSATSGYLYSDYGTPITLLANWNGLSTAPDIATNGQCAGSTFCGISGSGAIDTNSYYYVYAYNNNFNGNAGAVTLKAPGDIDLTNISISASGSYYYYYYNSSLAGGAGATISITSTKGNLTTNAIDASGGGGGYGASGGSSAVNGGTGGAGGAGGTVSLNAAGTLTLGGTVNVSGGYGGSGGNGYYDSSLATPAYTSAGGAGGAGGNAGAMSVSGTSLVLSGANLNAVGGTGGSGGSGTTSGSTGVSGSSSALVLATTGNATVTGYNFADSAALLVKAGGNVQFDSGASLSSAATGDALVLVAGGNFNNNADASALSAPNGSWLVYSTNPTLDTKGGLVYDFKQYGMSYNGSGYTGPGSGNGFIYSVAPTITPSLTGTSTKVYDGTTAASLASTNYLTTGALDGDTVVLSNPVTGTYSDKNVGTGKNVSASVALVSASNGTANVYGYTLSSPTAGGAIGNITQRPLSTWIGSTGGLWSDPANWDAIPDGSNVLAVSIPFSPSGGSYQVTYDASAGNTSLQTLTSAQTLALSGGNLTISGSLSTAGYIQSGGTLGGTGNLTVNNNFSQTGGSIALTGSAIAAITQTSGDLVIHSLAAPTVELTALTGGISQSGPIVTPALTSTSVSGANLTDNGNQITSFTATNGGSGDIALTSQGALNIAGIDNKGGNVTLTADSATATNAKVSATGDIIAIVAGDLKLNDGASFTAGNDIRLALNGATSTLFLNEQSGLRASYLWAEAPSTIHLDYAARTSGGLVIDGAAAGVNDFKSVAGSSGLFYGPTMVPAVLGAGLDVSGISRPPVVSIAAAAAIATVTSAITSSTTAATTTETSAANVEAITPPPPPTTAGTPSSLLLSNTSQTIGGTEGSFGGSQTTSGTSSNGQSPGSSDDKSASAKKDEKKEDEKNKQEETPAKKDGKPAAKKLATCS